jgi:hypothetical protein
MVTNRTPGSPGTRLNGCIRNERFGNNVPTAVRTLENTSTCSGDRFFFIAAVRSSGKPPNGGKFGLCPSPMPWPRPGMLAAQPWLCVEPDDGKYPRLNPNWCATGVW